MVECTCGEFKCWRKKIQQCVLGAVNTSLLHLFDNSKDVSFIINHYTENFMCIFYTCNIS